MTTIFREKVLLRWKILVSKLSTSARYISLIALSVRLYRSPIYHGSAISDVAMQIISIGS